MRIWIACFLFLSGCGSVRVFEMTKVQRDLQESLQKGESVTQKSQADYTQKKNLIDNLAQTHSAGFSEAEDELRKYLKTMNEALENMSAEKRKMTQANSDMVSLAYNRPAVHSNEAEYPQIEELVKKFEDAAGELNTAALNYSRESNSFADLVEQKKLYYSFDILDFQKRIQHNIATAQENAKIMQQELNRINNDEIHSLASDYSNRANRFAEIHREVGSLALGAPKITNLDPQWPKVQNLVNEFDRLLRDLGDLNRKFQTKLDALRNNTPKN